MNIHFVLGFPLAAIASFYFFRTIGVSRLVGATAALLFATAPYHFARGEGHLFLSWYFVVPLGMVVVYRLLVGSRIWAPRADAVRGLGHLTGRTGGTVGILALLASCSAYYAVFVLLLGGVAAIGAFWIRRSWRELASGVAAAGVTVAVILLNMFPAILHSALNGANPGALQRTPVETEIYALKLAQLLLPAPEHRYGPFAYLRGLYDSYYPLPSESPALGLIAAAGFIALMLTVAYVLVRSLARPGTLRITPSTRVLVALGLFAFVSFLFATVGGLSTFVSFVSTNLRAWNRISILIGLVSLAAIAVLVDRLAGRIGRIELLRGRPSWLAAAPLVAVLLVVGIWDQTPALTAQGRGATIQTFDSDAAFVADIERTAPTGSMIFELPYIAFPESPPINGVLDTDQLRFFLHSDTLRWSGGGIRGRANIDGLADIASLGPIDLVATARSLGYSGIVVDLMAYPTASPTSALLHAAGGPHLESPDGRFVYVGLDG